jgi:cyclopropane-fatty-acyl-phospholipid synthase
LPTADIVSSEAAKAGLRIVSRDAFGTSYAATLREWRRRFLASWGEIERLGFDNAFRQMWEYYLAYCETGFLHGAIDVSIFKLEHV